MHAFFWKGWFILQKGVKITAKGKKNFFSQMAPDAACGHYRIAYKFQVCPFYATDSLWYMIHICYCDSVMPLIYALDFLYNFCRQNSHETAYEFVLSTVRSSILADTLNPTMKHKLNTQTLQTLSTSTQPAKVKYL